MIKNKLLLGTTLIELLLSLTLSALVTSMIITIYLAAEKNFSLQTSLVNIGENMQFASHLLTTEIQQSGYIGCAKLTADFPIKTLSSHSLTINNKISITDNSLTSRHVSREHSNLLCAMTDDFVMYANPQPEFFTNEILVISDCQQADMFIVKDVIHNKNFQIITSQQSLEARYKKNAEISRLEINSFFIADTGRVSPLGKPVHALYKSDIHHHQMEMVEGIESLTAVREPKGVVLSLIFSDANLRKKWKRFFAL